MPPTTNKKLSPPAQLIRASINGDCVELSKLLELPSVNVNGYYHSKSPAMSAKVVDGTPLSYAAAYGRVEAVKLLLKHKADPLGHSSASMTPVEVAACNNQASVLEVLVKEGKLNPRRHLLKAFFHASTEGCPESLKCLLMAGVNPNWTLNDCEGTAIIKASGEGQHETMKILVEAGADVNYRTMCCGTNALMKTCEHGDLQGCKVLVEAGAKLKYKGTRGDQVFLCAARSLNVDILKYLVSKGCDVNATDFQGHNALYHFQDGLTSKEETVSRNPDTSMLGPVVLRNAKETLDFLLTKLQLNKYNSQGCTPLMYACYRDHPSAIRMLLEAGADVNFRSGNYPTALGEAVKSGNSEHAVRILLDNGACVYSVFDEELRQTVTHMAVSARNINVLKMLLDKGAPVDPANHPKLRDIRVRSPLQMAVEKRDYEMAELLLDRGADINNVLPAGLTALMESLLPAPKTKIDKTIVELLLNKGADPHIISNDGISALHLAALSLEPDIINLFVKRKANLNLRSVSGITPFMSLLDSRMFLGTYCDDLLVKKMVAKIVPFGIRSARIMVNAGVDLSARDNSGNTVLHIAASNPHSTYVEFLLKNFSMDVNVTNYAETTALMTASASGVPRSIALLLEHGANIDARNKTGSTSLEKAIVLKRFENAKTLIEAGANVNTKDKNGATPLLKLCHIFKVLDNLEGAIEVCKLLLKHGAHVNAIRTDFNTTPLMIAAAWGTSELVELLLEHGADIGLKNNKGLTAKEIAQSMKHPSLEVLKLYEQSDLLEEQVSALSKPSKCVICLERDATQLFGHYDTNTYVVCIDPVVLHCLYRSLC